MLSDSKIIPTIPVTDLARARQFYSEKLGLKEGAAMAGGVTFDAGGGSQIFLYERGPSTADHTLASFMVKDINQATANLKAKGVTMEHYDELPGGPGTDENGIATYGSTKSAWFKDPDGNILAITQNN